MLTIVARCHVAAMSYAMTESTRLGARTFIWRADRRAALVAAEKAKRHLQTHRRVPLERVLADAWDLS